MNGEHAPTAMSESRERYSYARLQGRWLLLARVGWVALVVLTLGIFFASLPVYVAQLQAPCSGPACYYTRAFHHSESLRVSLPGFQISPIVAYLKQDR
jgi:hypothetical protein